MLSTLLATHPRLYIGREEIDRLGQPCTHDYLRVAMDHVAEAADEFMTATDYDDVPDQHNGHLIRARRMQARVLTLIVRGFITGESRYHQTAFDRVRSMDQWEYWSWIAWRRGDTRPEAEFDISYGENSATLALTYDLLHDELTNDQRMELVALARRRSLIPYLHHVDGGTDLPRWFEKPGYNFNSVCNGGAGMLALAMYEHLDEAERVLAKVEQSLTPFLEGLAETDGGWLEGVQYWNYAWKYALMYLFSHERAMDRPHPLLRTDAVRKTLSFPLDFCPHGITCSFGDGRHWSPMPLHFAAADRLDCPEVLERLEAARGANPHWPRGIWDEAEILLLHPRRDVHSPIPEQREVVRLYKGMDWGMMADRLPDPNFYLAMRGGSTDVPHYNRDLLSFHCVVGDERLIENLQAAQYLDTTFSAQRNELFEIRPQSKNTILIDGVGMPHPATVKTNVIRIGEYPGIRVDATEAMGKILGADYVLADFCGRLFVWLEGQGALIVDRIELRHAGRVESRIHTKADVCPRQAGALLTGERQHLQVALAAEPGFELTTSTTLPTTPGDTATVLRWCGPKELHAAFWMAALLVPGAAEPTLRLDKKDEGVTIHIETESMTRALHLDNTLHQRGVPAGATDVAD